ncbi:MULTISPECIES: DUF6925 family protein [Sphingobium]|uniref:DUF6925 family protein n=1 Tax=Sphingobium TaxID=165695 RepID=UPI000B4A4918|nr:hypothetical protein [Sphingobium sp. Z007]
MHPVPFDLIADLALDPANGWSIGSFGAIGEFVRDVGEPAAINHNANGIEIVTARGGMRIDAKANLSALAWDSLSADGESWSHSLAFCVARPDSTNRGIMPLGPDRHALRPEDASAPLFDLGVGCGAVSMCLRTADTALIDILNRAEGQSMFSVAGLTVELLRAQPNRVMLSPAGRIEVFQHIPPANGKSPEGPHTHLLPKLIVKDRAHSANVPIPEGWQSALSAHPRSPWRTMLGEKHPYDPAIDVKFAPLLASYALEEDRVVDKDLRNAIESGATPEFAHWPETRRGRTKGRIVLRRMAAAGDDRVKPWRALHDRAPVELEEDEAV